MGCVNNASVSNQCVRSFSPSKCWPSASVQFWSATIHTDQGTGVCAYAVHGDDKRPSFVLAPLLRESLMQASPFLSNSAHHFAPISPWPSNRDHDAKDPAQYNLYSQLFCIQIMGDYGSGVCDTGAVMKTTGCITVNLNTSGGWTGHSQNESWSTLRLPG